MSTEIQFIFDKNLGLVEKRVPRNSDPNAGASVIVKGVLSASVVQGSGTGGGNGSFPLDPIPTENSILVTNDAGNPATVSGIRASAEEGIVVAGDYNKGINIVDTGNYGLRIVGAGNYGVNLSGNNNNGINVSGGYNNGINVSGDSNYGITISGDNNRGLQINTSYAGQALRIDGVDMVAKMEQTSRPLFEVVVTSPKNLSVSDAGKIFNVAAVSGDIVINIPDTLFDDDTGKGFVCSFKVVSVVGGSVTFVGTGDMELTYHRSDPGVTPLTTNDFVKIIVTSSSTTDIFVDVAL